MKSVKNERYSDVDYHILGLFISWIQTLFLPLHIKKMHRRTGRNLDKHNYDVQIYEMPSI